MILGLAAPIVRPSRRINGQGLAENSTWSGLSLTVLHRVNESKDYIHDVFKAKYVVPAGRTRTFSFRARERGSA
jgi:hypothetical protein